MDSKEPAQRSGSSVRGFRHLWDPRYNTEPLPPPVPYYSWALFKYYEYSQLCPHSFHATTDEKTGVTVSFIPGFAGQHLPTHNFNIAGLRLPQGSSAADHVRGGFRLTGKDGKYYIENLSDKKLYINSWERNENEYRRGKSAVVVLEHGKKILVYDVKAFKKSIDKLLKEDDPWMKISAKVDMVSFNVNFAEGYWEQGITMEERTTPSWIQIFIQEACKLFDEAKEPLIPPYISSWS